MKIFVQYKISEKDIHYIYQKVFLIPQAIRNTIRFSNENAVLVKILIPHTRSEIYSIIENQYLLLGSIEIDFFQTMKIDDSLFIKFETKDFPSDNTYQVFFSKSKGFLDLNIENSPIVSEETVDYLLQPYIR